MPSMLPARLSTTKYPIIYRLTCVLTGYQFTSDVEYFNDEGALCGVGKAALMTLNGSDHPS